MSDIFLKIMKQLDVDVTPPAFVWNPWGMTINDLGGRENKDINSFPVADGHTEVSNGYGPPMPFYKPKSTDPLYFTQL